MSARLNWDKVSRERAGSKTEGKTLGSRQRVTKREETEKDTFVPKNLRGARVLEGGQIVAQTWTTDSWID